MNQKKYSLYFILASIIVLIATVSTTIISSYKYIQTKEYLELKIKNNSIDTLDKLKYIMVPYMESYSVSEYENIIQNEMKDKNIFAIVVEDYKIAEILGKKHFETGKIRDKDWNIINYDETKKQMQKRLFLVDDSYSESIINKQGEIIGKIFIYNTHTFMKEELAQIIKESIIFIIISSILLIVVSFLLIHTILLKPLEDIIKIITHNSSQGVSLNPIEEKGFKEIYMLCSTINKMIYSIKDSQEQLNDINKNLNVKVEEKTKELQELNFTLEKKIEEELEKGKQKDILLHNQSRFASMGEMIGNIAHQWRQPLNALSITVQKVQRYYHIGKLDDEVLDKSIEKSMNLIQKMSSTIDDFMGFYREEKVKITFDVVEAINETISLLDASLKNSFIEIKIIHANESIKFDGFKGEFTQVILNIVSNAKDAIQENNISTPKIEIKITQDAQFIQIEIIDNAGGIPNNILNNIFDPYFTTKEEGNGTGIGLYMSKVIIEQNMHGELSAVNLEDGACFIIKLEKKDRG